MDYQLVPLEELCEQARIHIERYYRHQPNDPGYAFELFRRTLAEKNQEAFSCVYKIYYPKMCVWAQNHQKFPGDPWIPEDFAHPALMNFYRANRGEKFQRFAHLAQLVKFLYCCVDTEIKQHQRKNRLKMLELSENYDPPDNTQPHHYEYYLIGLDCWEKIDQALNNTVLADLLYFRYFLDMKPAEISERYPHLWPTSRDVTIALQKIKRRLADNTDILDCLRASLNRG